MEEINKEVILGKVGAVYGIKGWLKIHSFTDDFPHKVNMASNSYGVPSIYLDEMIQVCMRGPMESKILKWGSGEMNNLTVFMQEEHKRFKNQ